MFGSLQTHLAHLFQSNAIECNRKIDLTRTWTLRRRLIRVFEFERVKYFFSPDSFRKDNIEKMKQYFLSISLLKIKSVHRCMVFTLKSDEMMIAIGSVCCCSDGIRLPRPPLLGGSSIGLWPRTGLWRTGLHPIGPEGGSLTVQF